MSSYQFVDILGSVHMSISLSFVQIVRISQFFVQILNIGILYTQVLTAAHIAVHKFFTVYTFTI